MIARAGIVDELLDGIQQRLTENVSEHIGWMFSPLIRWYFLFFVFLVACSAIIWFFGWWNPVRVVIGIAVALAGAFLAGGTVMYRNTRSQLQKDQTQIDLLKKEQRDRQKAAGGAGSGSWTNWFGGS